ncbi:hypothetical protein D9M68_926100 [compost metagenome]
MNGIRKFGPGVMVPWYLPRRSRTHAFCCGTNLTDWLMKMIAMTRMMRGTENSMVCFLFECVVLTD